MAKFRKYLKRKLAKKFRKWARKAQRTVNVNRALSPIPQRYITKMKYSQTITTGATFANYAMNLNSVYDPDQTGVLTGHQAYGFDQLAALYNRYRVIACGWRLNLAVGSATVPVIMTAMPANTVVTASTGSEIRENPRSKYITQNPGASSAILKGKSYIPSLVGRSKAQYMADDRYQSEVTGNPAEQAILNIQTWTGSDAYAPGVQVQVLLEYTVEFFDIKSLGQS